MKKLIQYNNMNNLYNNIYKNIIVGKFILEEINTIT